jgi:predicted nucleotidyltransferase
VTIMQLRDLAQALVSSRPDVESVYLFGSLATDRHAPGSDADLLVVLTEDKRRLTDRVPELLRAFLKAPVPVDVFPFTRQELAQKQQQGNAFVRQALTEGILLAARESESDTADLH